MNCPLCGERMRIEKVESDCAEPSHYLIVTATCHNYSTGLSGCRVRPKMTARFCGRTLFQAMAKADIAGWWPTGGELENARHAVEEAPL